MPSPTAYPSVAHRIAAARLHAQHLGAPPTLTSAADVVRTLGAVQAQDYGGAKWALGMRAVALTDAGIDRAFDDGEILRTHVMRPTWHFVAPEDLRWMLALTAPRIAAAMAPYNKKLELDRAVFRKSHAVIEKALAKHGALTRTALKAHLERAGVNTEGSQRLGHLMMKAEIDALICSGPRQGKQFTYALVAERAPRSRDLTDDAALLELTRRFFASRAPATVHDFAWWSKLTIGMCRRGVDMAGGELQKVSLDDVDYWAPPGFELPERVPLAAHLLPNYDEYFIGYRDRSAIAKRIGSSKLVTGGNALIAHVVVIDGQLVGGWKRSPDHSEQAATLDLVVKLTGAEHRLLDSVIAQYGAFLQRPA